MHISTLSSQRYDMSSSWSKVMSKLNEQVVKMSMTSTYAILLSCSELTHKASQKAPFDQLLRKEKLRIGLKMMLHDMLTSPKRGQKQHYNSTMVILKKGMVKRNPLSEWNFMQHTWLLFTQRHKSTDSQAKTKGFDEQSRTRKGKQLEIQ